MWRILCRKKVSPEKEEKSKRKQDQLSIADFAALLLTCNTQKKQNHFDCLVYCTLLYNHSTDRPTGSHHSSSLSQASLVPSAGIRATERANMASTAGGLARMQLRQFVPKGGIVSTPSCSYSTAAVSASTATRVSHPHRSNTKNKQRSITQTCAKAVQHLFIQTQLMACWSGRLLRRHCLKWERQGQRKGCHFNPITTS